MQSGVLDLLFARLDLGKKRYGHGVKIDSDTREWGTVKNDWLEMMQEELLDGMIYCAADELRRNSHIRPEDKSDDNDAIIQWIQDSIDHVVHTDQPVNIHHEILKKLYDAVLMSLSIQTRRQK